MEASKPSERAPLQLILTNLAKPSTSGAKETTVKYGDVEVLPGNEVVMVNCTPGSAEVDAKMQAELERQTWAPPGRYQQESQTNGTSSG